jgi:chorismate lyase/3-hydroxybenzoate synthase
VTAVPVTSPSRTSAAAPLAFRRLQLGSLPSDHTLLGARVLGRDADAVGALLLAPAGNWADAWLGDGKVEHRQHGCVRYASNGEWLHGVAEVDDAVTDGGLRAATHRAYADLFEVLARSESPHLLRLWNYITDINVETDGSERYRQFNAGRQQAFIEAERSAFEGSPAACALGTRTGPLRVYFLAGRRAPLAIENPRQVSAYRYPQAYGPRSPTFSRAALADVGGGRHALFISGTASIVGHETMHLGDVRRQTQESLVNIRMLREIASQQAGASFDADRLIYTVYVRQRDDLEAVRSEFESVVGATSRAARDALYLHADICRAGLLVEIEAHGFVPFEDAT